jgi:hypothetical protein
MRRVKIAAPWVAARELNECFSGRFDGIYVSQGYACAKSLRDYLEGGVAPPGKALFVPSRVQWDDYNSTNVEV